MAFLDFFRRLLGLVLYVFDYFLMLRLMLA